MLAFTISVHCLPAHFKVEVSRKTASRRKCSTTWRSSPSSKTHWTLSWKSGLPPRTMNVNASEAPLIDTETGQISGTITGKEIQYMPVFGRDIFQVVQLAPGFFGDGARNGGGGTQCHSRQRWAWRIGRFDRRVCHREPRPGVGCRRTYRRQRSVARRRER